MLTITIIDDRSTTCDITAQALTHVENIKIVGHACNVSDAASHIAMSDIVLLKASLPTNRALKAVTTIIRYNPASKILVFMVKKSEAAALAFIEAGCNGYVFEDDSFAELVRNIYAVQSNHAHISSHMAASLILRVQELKALSAQLSDVYQYRGLYDRLTKREREVLELLGEGLTTRHIAEKLYVQFGTAKNHIHNILKKLQVTNRHDATIFLVLQQT